MAVGRYQHAHAASTYSYALALSRSPSPSSRCPIPFCNLLTLSSFRRLTFLSHPPLSHVSLFFPPSLRSLFCLLSLSLFVVLFFPQNIIYLLFVSSYFHSRFRLLYLLLSKIFSPDFLSLVFSARTSIIFIDIYDGDSNYPILAAVAHLVRTKKSFDPIRLFISALFLAAPRPFSSFLGYCSLFFRPRIIIFSWFPTCDAALCLFMLSFFTKP